MRLAPLLALLLVPACSIGAPPGFSSGNSWSFPLVTPLEGGPLLVPVTIQDKGPYLFLVDPDAPTSIVDEGVASEADLRAVDNIEYLDESDKERNVRVAEVLKLQVGTLTVKMRNVMITGIGTFNTGGHQVRGVLGRDVLADSLVFGFDRNAGMAYLATQQGFVAPANATKTGYELLKNRLQSGITVVSRRLVHATIDGSTRTVHVDLGDWSSQLRDKFKGGLTPVPIKRTLVDEAGTHRDVTSGVVAKDVAVAGAHASNIVFVPYADPRWDDDDIDGTVGLSVFDGDRVWDNFSSSELYVEPDPEVAPAARIARWGEPRLTACAQPACTTATVASADTTGTAKPILTVTRDASVADVGMEVLLEAQTADGKPIGVPRFVVIFGPGETTTKLEVDDAYAGAKLVALDVSPFPRACPAGMAACVYTLGQNK